MGASTVATVGLLAKAFLYTRWAANASVSGLSTLVAALESDERYKGRGVVTVANHISTLDDPVAWGILPARYYFSSWNTRWALGASDIMFTNPLFSTFFRHGQVIETFRGKGVYQQAIDDAILKLDQGAWVHLFGEGKVNQPNTLQVHDGRAILPRFKWGVGRILMETKLPPVIIPMWLTGFDQLMPEGRPFPYKYLPRLNARLSITFGDPLPADQIANALAGAGPPSQDIINQRAKPSVPDAEVAQGWMGDAIREKQMATDLHIAQIRSAVTAIVHRGVEDLGRKVSGNLLGAQPTSRI